MDTADVHALHRVSKCSTEDMGEVSVRSPRMESDDHIGIACVPEQKQDLLRIEGDRDVVSSDKPSELLSKLFPVPLHADHVVWQTTHQEHVYEREPNVRVAVIKEVIRRMFLPRRLSLSHIAARISRILRARYLAIDGI
jgi:hypothetical protein